MTPAVHDDPIADFYERHPYPPPVDELRVSDTADRDRRRRSHHLIWPRTPPPDTAVWLVAGCGTSQAARHALVNPDVRVVGIDVSASSVEHTRRLADQHELANLEVHQLPIERAAELDQRFDHVVCTGVLHHLADPGRGLEALRTVLAPAGALTLMVYAQYGRTGVYMLQEYCRRLGIAPTPHELHDLVATLGELPAGHPLDHVLRNSRDFHDDDALADALLNPRDRAYSVPELFELLSGAGFRFGRWERQAPYRPDCGSIGETPHASRIARLAEADRYAAVELFRGTITRHTVIAFAADDPTSGHIDFDDPDVEDWIPIVPPTAIAVEERLPRGAAAALLNRAHSFPDLVMFVDRTELDTFRSIDGERSIGALAAGAARFVERLWSHDLVVIDASVASRP